MKRSRNTLPGLLPRVRRPLPCYRRAQAGVVRVEAGALLAAAAIVALFGLAPAARAADGGRFPITDEQRRIAEKFTGEGVALGELAPDAPASHTVVRGDTLWSLASLYLRSPWRWPELWGMNLSDVRNPHLIYPGQVLVLVRTDGGRARLSLQGAGTGNPPAAGSTAAASPAPDAAAPAETAPAASSAALPGDRSPAGALAGMMAASAAATTAADLNAVHLHPRVRDEGEESAAAIASIPNNAIEPFLSQPAIVGAHELEGMPRIVATPDAHVFLGAGDSAYARGIGEGAAETYSIFRPARPLFDFTDLSHRHPIAWEAFYLGSARVTHRSGDVTTVDITRAREEVGVGDRLMPVTSEAVLSYVPHHPSQAIDGAIIDVYGGVDYAGAQSVVTLNRGRSNGLEIGHVLSVLHRGETVSDRSLGSRDRARLPDEQVGLAFVFRVFDGVSYALLMSSTGPVKIGDRVVDPDSALAQLQQGTVRGATH